MQAAYLFKGWLYVLLGKGYKSALYLWRKNQSGYKTLFENIALQLFSLPLNCIFLFLQLEVVILDLGPENSFVNFLRSTRKNLNGRGSAGRCFYQEDTE